MSGEIEKSVVEPPDDDDRSESNENLSFERSVMETAINCSDPLEVCQNQVERLHCLRNVAEKLGVENTRNHLIPYVTHLILAEELSELKDLAVILGDFERYVGGPKYAHILLLPLEELAGAKLSEVRSSAVRSLQALASIMEVSDLETHFMPLIGNMTMDSKCAKRWSVCHLFTTVYVRVGPKHQGDLINYHCFLCFDSIPSVRQDAARILVDLSEAVHPSVFDSKLIPRLEQFRFDQNEHVRTLALSAALSISKIFDVDYIKLTILPVILDYVGDSSWSVRLMLVTHFTKLLSVGVSCSKFTENIMQALTVLTKDRQSEIRLKSANILFDCSVVLYENLNRSEAETLVVKFLIPELSRLSQDSDVQCRLEVLAVLAKFGKIISNELIKDYFVDLVKKLLRDRNVDVVFNVVKHMKDILGPRYCNRIVIPEDRLICCLKAFIVNNSWEMRNMGAIYLGILAVQMGLKFFEEYLEQSFLILLTDAKSTVQQTAMDVLKLLVKEFGMDWVQTYIMPYLIKLSYSKNTYNKMAFLSFAKNFFEICDQSMLKKLFPRVVYHQSDENPNVRGALIETLNVMMTSYSDLDDIMVDRIRTTLKILVTDKSNFIGALATQIWNEHFNGDVK